MGNKITDSVKPMPGGSYSGVWTVRGGYIRPKVAMPNIARSSSHMIVGWLDPMTAVASEAPIPAGRP